jgi:hypothetical protein
MCCDGGDEGGARSKGEDVVSREARRAWPETWVPFNSRGPPA